MGLRTFDSQHDAHECALVTPEDDSRWLKVVSGRRFIVELGAGGKLLEWPEDDPSDTWTGTWRTRSFYNPGWWEALVHLYIGDYRTRMRLQEDGSFKGYEVSPEAWEAEDRRDRETHPDMCFHNQPSVTLTRL